MATLIPAHTERMPTVLEVRGTFKAIVRTIPKWWKDVHNTARIIFFDIPIYIISWSQTFERNKLFTLGISFIMVEPSKDPHLAIAKMKKHGTVTLSMNQDFIEYDVPEYVKHDFDSTYVLHKGVFTQVTDELPNTEGRTFKVLMYESVTYFCEDCNDLHTRKQEIESRWFFTKKEALDFVKFNSTNNKLRKKGK